MREKRDTKNRIVSSNNASYMMRKLSASGRPLRARQSPNGFYIGLSPSRVRLQVVGSLLAPILGPMCHVVIDRFCRGEVEGGTRPAESMHVNIAVTRDQVCTQDPDRIGPYGRKGNNGHAMDEHVEGSSVFSGAGAGPAEVGHQSLPVSRRTTTTWPPRQGVSSARELVGR